MGTQIIRVTSHDYDKGPAEPSIRLSVKNEHCSIIDAACTNDLSQ